MKPKNKLTKQARKHDPKSEAAMRRAIRDRGGLEWRLFIFQSVVQATGSDGELIAEFDLRDCYRKRAPLKGITKAMRKAVQPKRKAKR